MSTAAAIETRPIAPGDVMPAHQVRDLLLNSLLNMEDFGILLLADAGLERRVALANLKFCQFFHFTRERILGITAERLASLCRKRILLENSAPALLAEGLVAKGPPQHCEFSLVDSGAQTLLQTSSPALNARGLPAGRLLIYRDITQEKHGEGQIVHRQKMESVGTLAGGIAHDFNNILTAIFGYTGSLMAELAEVPSALEKLQQIQKSANRAADLTSNLLAFSRKNPYLPQPVNLSQLTESTGNMLMFTMPENIRLEFGALVESSFIEADPTQIQQVLTQLITNARDAIVGEGSIRLSTRIGLDAQSIPSREQIEYAILDVEDTGVGVPKDSIARIFEPFYTTKGPGKGVGLGLSMVYGVVKQHRGFIEVESAPGEGSRFSVFLPLMSPQPAPPEPPEPGLGLKKHDACVMVVEDEANLRELCEVALSETCREVLVARNGLDAIQLFKTHGGDVDLVLLDMTMPGMGGADCFRELRELAPGVRVLICSGYSEEMGASELIEQGALGFLAKPYTLQTIVQRVAGLLDELGDTTKSDDD